MIDDLVKMSHFAGERYDLIQAGGGNSSVKENGKMYIKASGFHLSEMTKTSGYSTVDNQKILDILEFDFSDDKRQNDKITAEFVKQATLDGPRPSIETLLHSMFDIYTLHTHPIAVNVVCASENVNELLAQIFKDEKYLFVPYKTPGIELALELKKQIALFEKKYNSKPQIVFLQNHGLIVSSNKIEEIYSLTNYVVSKINSFLKLNLEKYQLTNKISELMNNEVSAYLSEDYFINEQIEKNKALFFVPPFCPDKMVYCLSDSVELKSFTDIISIQKFKEKYGSYPKVVIFDKYVFLTGSSIKKCRETEELLKFHLMVLSHIKKEDRQILSNDELAYLGNWEAEKYRQKI